MGLSGEARVPLTRASLWREQVAVESLSLLLFPGEFWK